MTYVTRLALLFMAGAAVHTVTAAGGETASANFWSRHDSTSTERIDHAAWNRFLDRYVVPGGPGAAREYHAVRYGAVSAADRAVLTAYLDRLQAVRVTSLNRPEQTAYWINLYNALTVDVILRHYPVASIRDIKLSVNPLKAGPWDADLAQVQGRRLSLNDIEHRILRPIMRDARLHFALNCASVGCPDLQPAAYTARNLDSLLTHGARGFVNAPRGVSFHEGVLRLSSIFDWYQEDFGEDESALLGFLASFANPPLCDRLRGYDGKITYQYDWRLNDTEREQ